MSNDILLIETKTIDPIKVFQDGGLDPILKEIEQRAKDFEADPETEEGRKTIKSMAYAVARSKTTLDDFGKNLVSDWKQKAKNIDAERRKAREFLDELKEEIRKPVTDYELRIETFEENIAQMRGLIDIPEGVEVSSEAYNENINQVREIYDQEWEEFQDNATAVYDMVVSELEKKLSEQMQREKEQAELEALRQEKEERERQEALERAKEEGARKAKEEAKVAEQQKAEAAKRRAADKEHKRKINRLALEAIIEHSGLSEDDGMKVLKAIVKGDIPNVSIRY